MKINKKVLISNFRNMNNYGSAMMGLITIQALITKYGKENIENLRINLFCLVCFFFLT